MFESGELLDEIPSDDSECDDNQVDLSDPHVIVLVSLTIVVTYEAMLVWAVMTMSQWISLQSKWYNVSYYSYIYIYIYDLFSIEEVV